MTTTWPQSGRAVAQLLSLKILPQDEEDTSPTIQQFLDKPVFVSSFRLTQKDMFESVKRVTETSDKDWEITYESSKKRWEDAQARAKDGNGSASVRQMYSRMFFPSADGDYEPVHNEMLELPTEDLDECTTVAISIGVNGEVPFGH
jgi:hypothetical protein